MSTRVCTQRNCARAHHQREKEKENFASTLMLSNRATRIKERMQAKVAMFKLWKLPWLLKRILLHERCKNFSRDNALSVLSRLKWNALTFSNDNCATAETSTIQLPRVSRLACIFSRKINIRVAFALSLYLCATWILKTSNLVSSPLV